MCLERIPIKHSCTAEITGSQSMTRRYWQTVRYERLNLGKFRVRAEIFGHNREIFATSFPSHLVTIVAGKCFKARRGKYRPYSFNHGLQQRIVMRSRQEQRKAEKPVRQTLKGV